MIVPFLRRALAFGACAVLLAGCGGDAGESSDAPAAQAATTPAADSTAFPAFPAFPSDTTQPSASAPMVASVDSAAPAPPVARRDRPVSPQDRPISDTTRLKEALAAPVTGPVNVEAVGSYQLTMDRVRQLVRVGQSLAQLQARRPELADSVRLGGFDPNSMYQKINSIPEVRDAVTRAGMSPREYSIAMAALLQAVMVHQMRERGMSPQVPVNEANVEFVDEHLDEIQQVARAAMGQMRPRS